MVLEFPPFKKKPTYTRLGDDGGWFHNGMTRLLGTTSLDLAARLKNEALQTEVLDTLW